MKSWYTRISAVADHRTTRTGNEITRGESTGRLMTQNPAAKCQQ